jgi:hypothetical protein
VIAPGARCWCEIAVAVVAIRTPWRWRYLNAPLARRQRGDAERIWRRMWAVSLHHLKPITCLEYAAALHRMLKRNGVDCRLRIGVREAPEDAPLAAHAWVELPGGTRLEVVEQPAQYLPLEAPDRP